MKEYMRKHDLRFTILTDMARWYKEYGLKPDELPSEHFRAGARAHSLRASEAGLAGGSSSSLAVKHSGAFFLSLSILFYIHPRLLLHYGYGTHGDPY